MTLANVNDKLMPKEVAMNILAKLWKMLIRAIIFICGYDEVYDAIQKCPHCGASLVEEIPGGEFYHDVCPKCHFDPMAAENKLPHD